MERKYIFVTGGVVSGLGKGITAASIGRILKSRGVKVTIQKFDPYLNIDSGLISPCQHGETYVTEDGLEGDLDLGHYERFIDENLNKFCDITTGRVYMQVLNKEREGEYKGKTIQVIPHITNEIKDTVYKAGELSESEVVITEIGGTVGDIESQPFLEAIRQIHSEKGHKNVMFVHVTLIPYLPKSEELKTKPTQHSCKELMSIGIIPDIIVARTSYKLDQEMKEKISLFCNIESKNVIENLDVDTIYDVPFMFEEQNLGDILCERFNIKREKDDLKKWYDECVLKEQPKEEVEIALVGKYVSLKDAYISLCEALKHASNANNVKVNIRWADAENIEKNGAEKELNGVKGIIIGSGFGTRGVEGKIQAITYAREKNISLLGIGFGMQLMIIEYFRKVLNLKDASSIEFDPNSETPVIIVAKNGEKGPVMRLGKHTCVLKEDSKVFEIYKEKEIEERHRHKYIFNNDYTDIISSNGFKITGSSKEENIAEVIEMINHKWAIGVQYQPEFKSRPNRAHPLFIEFIKSLI